MTTFVDTSALIAILDADDVRHAEAGAIFRSIVGTGELITHNYIHVEAQGVIRRRLGTDAARSLVDDLLPLLRTVWVDEAVHGAALAAHRARGGTTSLVDEVSFLVMRTSGADRAFAFDAEFEAQGFERPAAAQVDPGHRLRERAAPYGATDEGDQDLVGVSEIAARAGRPINTVQSWRRRNPDFPVPVAQLATGPVWLWPAVSRWIHIRTRGGKPALPGSGESLPVPANWGRTLTGEPMPDIVGLVRRSRMGH